MSTVVSPIIIQLLSSINFVLVRQLADRMNLKTGTKAIILYLSSKVIPRCVNVPLNSFVI